MSENYSKVSSVGYVNLSVKNMPRSGAFITFA